MFQVRQRVPDALESTVQLGVSLLEVREGQNLVTNVGKERLAAIIAGLTSTLPGYVAIGTTNTAANVADTTLAAEITTDGFIRKISV